MQEETKMEVEKQKTAKMNREFEQEKQNTTQKENEGKRYDLLQKIFDRGECTGNEILEALSKQDAANYNGSQNSNLKDQRRVKPPRTGSVGNVH